MQKYITKEEIEILKRKPKEELILSEIVFLQGLEINELKKQVKQLMYIHFNHKI